jgi:hypothetical protein
MEKASLGKQWEHKAQLKLRRENGPTTSEPKTRWYVTVRLARMRPSLPVYPLLRVMAGTRQHSAAAAWKHASPPHIAVSPADPPPRATSMAAGGGGGGDISADSERRLKKAMDKLYHFPKPKSSSTGGSKASSSVSAPRFCPNLFCSRLLFFSLLFIMRFDLTCV